MFNFVLLRICRFSSWHLALSISLSGSQQALKGDGGVDLPCIDHGPSPKRSLPAQRRADVAVACLHPKPPPHPLAGETPTLSAQAQDHLSFVSFFCALILAQGLPCQESGTHSSNDSGTNSGEELVAASAESVPELVLELVPESPTLAPTLRHLWHQFCTSSDSNCASSSTICSTTLAPTLAPSPA